MLWGCLPLGYINFENTISQGTQYEKIQISFSIPWNNEIDKTFFFIMALSILNFLRLIL